jgi:hypothetical protein
LPGISQSSEGIETKVASKEKNLDSHVRSRAFLAVFTFTQLASHVKA